VKLSVAAVLQNFSRMLKHPNNLSPNLRHCSFQQLIQLLGIKSDSHTDVHYVAYTIISLTSASFFSYNGNYCLVNQALSRTSKAKVQNFQASGTFRGLEKWKKIQER